VAARSTEIAPQAYSAAELGAATDSAAAQRPDVAHFEQTVRMIAPARCGRMFDPPNHK